MSAEVKAKSIRLFFALWPQEAERQALAAWQKPLHQQYGGRVMRAEGLHATLVFLGDVAAERLAAAQRAARSVAGSSFELVWQEARCWRHNRIVFAAPTLVPAALQSLVETLQAALQQQGFALEPRSYQAHVTLLRDARCPEATALPAMPAVHWQMREFVLLQSVLTHAGSQYQVLSRYPLC